MNELQTKKLFLYSLQELFNPDKEDNKSSNDQIELYIVQNINNIRSIECLKYRNYFHIFLNQTIICITDKYA